MFSQRFFRHHKRPRPIRAFSLVELLVAIGIVGVLLAILLTAIVSSRESSRRSQCSSNLRQLGLALQSHHEAKKHLPPAVIWSPAGEPLGDDVAPPGTMDRVTLAVASAAEPDRVFANWVILILSYLEEQALKETFDLALPVAGAPNQKARATELPVMKCPSDDWNGPDNRFQRAGLMAADDGYARGNFAMNGGSNARCLMELNGDLPAGTCVDGFHVNGTSLKNNTSQVWGSGIGGLNKRFSYREFPNGLSKTVALEEIRAGIHPLDRRGVWALGFPGSSITVAHGISNKGGPNTGKDRIQGCSAFISQTANVTGMPCNSMAMNPQFEISEQATSRSTHVAGVNLLMADGSAHFVIDEIDRNVWHQMHKRDNQGTFELPF